MKPKEIVSKFDQIYKTMWVNDPEIYCLNMSLLAVLDFKGTVNILDVRTFYTMYTICYETKKQNRDISIITIRDTLLTDVGYREIIDKIPVDEAIKNTIKLIEKHEDYISKAIVTGLAIVRVKLFGQDRYVIAVSNRLHSIQVPHTLYETLGQELPIEGFETIKIFFIQEQRNETNIGGVLHV